MACCTAHWFVCQICSLSSRKFVQSGWSSANSKLWEQQWLLTASHFTSSCQEDFLAVAEIPAWRKIRKAFSSLANLQTVSSGLMKFLSGLVQLGEVYWDLTVFTETSAQWAAKAHFSPIRLKLNYNADDQFQPMTGKCESMTIFLQAQYWPFPSVFIYCSVGLMSSFIWCRFFIWLKSKHDMTVKTLRLEECHTAS